MDSGHSRSKSNNREVASCVHSTNSNCPTSTGLNHRHSAIFAAVSPAPQRPAFFSGSFTNGHFFVSRGLNFFSSSARSYGIAIRSATGFNERLRGNCPTDTEYLL